MATPTALPSSSWQLGFFFGEPWNFYFGRLLELSPLYVLSYSIFFLPHTPQQAGNTTPGGSGHVHGDRVLLSYTVVALMIIIVWDNYQCRYLLPASVPLLVLAARVATACWRALSGARRPWISWSGRAVWIALLGLAVAKTIFIDAAFVLPNDMVYY